jgi:isopentenyldiphosphate isomerase
MSFRSRYFFDHLSITDRKWLIEQLSQASQMPSDDWRIWHLNANGSPIKMGWVPHDRLEQMSSGLADFRCIDGQWHWIVQDQSFDAISHDLQEWLRIQHDLQKMNEWRYELQDFFISNLADPHPTAENELPIFKVERGGFPHLGITSRAIHVNGFTDKGQILVGKRSKNKSIDPGLFDNLMAGGMLTGETWKMCFERELLEEAGLDAKQWPSVSCLGSFLSQQAETECFRSEKLYVINLDVPGDVQPMNQDGEVQCFELFDPHETIERMRQNQFTRDGVLTLAYGLLNDFSGR